MRSFLFLSAASRVAVVALLMSAASSVDAAPGDVRVKPVEVVGPVNELPGWLVRLSVSHKDRTYQVGDEVTLDVISEKDGHLYVVGLDAEGNVGMLFPNRMQSNNKILANTKVTVPDPADRKFRLRVGKEAIGKELVWAIVTRKPAPELDELALAEGTTLVPADKFRAMLLRVATGNNQARGKTVREATDEVRKNDPKGYAKQCLGWAEHKLEITTVLKRGGPPQQRRRAVFVGVSEFADAVNIHKLDCAHQDAQKMAEVMAKYGKLDDMRVLLNKDATLANIRAAFTWLVANTKPGDLALIYWSGHGGRCPNADGSEPDGCDAFLVPYDGKVEATRETMLMDKTFGRWVQELDGRKVVVILDTCHSGGQIEGMKAPHKAARNKDGTLKFSRGIDAPGVKPNARWNKQHFLETEMIRVRGIGQKDAAILAARSARQFAWERAEKDLGVMTFYLVERLGKGTEPLTLEDLARYAQKKVPEYIKANFDGAAQTPVFSDETPRPRARLRP